MSSLFCVSAAAAEAVVLVEGSQRREPPAPPRSAVMRCVTRDGAVSVSARLLCRTWYSARPVSGESSVLLHLEGPWPPSSVCLAPPASSGSSWSPAVPRSPLAALRLGRPGLRLGACLQPLHGEAPGSPGRLSGSRSSWPQACPSRPGGAHSAVYL